MTQIIQPPPYAVVSPAAQATKKRSLTRDEASADEQTKAIIEHLDRQPQNKDEGQEDFRVPQIPPNELRIWMQEGEWKEVERLCELYPSLARENIEMILQGETSSCLPLHYICARESAPLSTIDAFVTAHPNSLLVQESRGDRLPLHLAILKGASYGVVQYLSKAQSHALSQEDSEGNLPLHYAAMYSTTSIVELLLKSFPQGCSHANKSGRLPLHLLCSRCWDHEEIPISTFRNMIESNPSALSTHDRQGRVPLHIIASSGSVRREILELLLEFHSEALLATDNNKLIPLELAQKFSTRREDKAAIINFLCERTNQERRKRYKLLAPFKNVSIKICRIGPKLKPRKRDVDDLRKFRN